MGEAGTRNPSVVRSPSARCERLLSAARRWGFDEGARSDALLLRLGLLVSSGKTVYLARGTPKANSTPGEGQGWEEQRRATRVLGIRELVIGSLALAVMRWMLKALKADGHAKSL
jgi:hypothetical protein